jgi:transcriptional regulator with XRE-family HTH domain
MGAAIRRARVEAGLTQRQLADRIGAPQTTLSHYEAGRATPEWGRMSLIAAACGVALWVLVKYGEEAAAGVVGEAMAS